MKKAKMIGIMVLVFVIGFSTSALTNSMHGYFNDFAIVKVNVNGKIYNGEIPAILFHGNTFVPLRFVSEEIGAEVEWSGSTQTAKVKMTPKIILVKDYEYEWKVIENEFYNIRYVKGFEEDALQMEEFLEIARLSMIQEFSQFDIIPLLKDPNLDVHLEPVANDKAGDGHWSIITRHPGIGSEHKSDIYLLSPSARLRECCTLTGDPFDEKYTLHTTIHEYSTLVLQGLTGKEFKGEGWFIYSSPSWFNQGYEEYLGNKYGPRKPLPKYIQMVIEDPTRITFKDTGISVENHYSEGMVLLAFLHDTFGKEKMQKLLVSKEASFETAFEKELAPWDKLEGMFNEWLSK